MTEKLISSAGEFHNLAYPFLQSLGFELEIEPSQAHFSAAIRGISRVVYQHKNGLYLVAGFDPYDSSSARLIFGRYWTWEKPHGKAYSNNYCYFSRYFGFPLEDFFSFRNKDADEVYTLMLSSLEESMSDILEKLTLESLQEIEMIGPFGAGFKSKKIPSEHLNGAHISSCEL